MVWNCCVLLFWYMDCTVTLFSWMTLKVPLWRPLVATQRFSVFIHQPRYKLIADYVSIHVYVANVREDVRTVCVFVWTYVLYACMFGFISTVVVVAVTGKRSSGSHWFIVISLKMHTYYLFVCFLGWTNSAASPDWNMSEQRFQANELWEINGWPMEPSQWHSLLLSLQRIIRFQCLWQRHASTISNANRELLVAEFPFGGFIPFQSCKVRYQKFLFMWFQLCDF